MNEQKVMFEIKNKEIRRLLDEISFKIKTNQIATRFNYSCGLINGDAFGVSWEEDNTLSKRKDKMEKEELTNGNTK